MRPRTRSNRTLIYYLLLNILVSAATTLAVLFAWDHFTQREVLPDFSQVLNPAAQTEQPAAAGAGGPTEDPALAAPAAQRPLPPIDVPVIEITGVVGAGDVDQEILTLKRSGEGDLHMAGWKLYDEGGNVYVFPDTPELVLFAGGAVQVHSRGGSDTATDIYWNRNQAVYQSTELITLEDPLGNVRATYRVP